MNKINRLAIFGVGKSGVSAVKLAHKLGIECFAVNSGDVDSWYEKSGIYKVLEKNKCFSSESFDFSIVDKIILSPGIPKTHKDLELALRKGVPLISEIEWAWEQVSDVPTIAITGTNGKTTTTTMIFEALKALGKKVFVGGNIGIPYSEMPLTGIQYDFAVIEVSSFQLETIKTFHPRIGLILNVFPNHSERYDEVEEYAKAKFRLLKNMNKEDHLVLGKENPYLGLIEATDVQKSYFKKGELPQSFQFDFIDAKVKGEHNEANFFATYKVLELLGVENLDSFFQKFILDFKGVPHRLEFVLEYNGLKVYNDAKSTNTLATSTAIKAFQNDPSPLYLILGGKLRNESDRILPDLLPFKKKVEEIYTIGEVSKRLEKELGNDFKVIGLETIQDVLKKVKGKKGNLVFSPAHPSFDQFKNFEDRGEKFKQFVREILNDGP